ncbi:PAC2 family protein [Microbacterium sp. No. 7]|uniref:PAC2 family protein n=1 Tax=Microbacterium sp. No. 7 TaxID=1714373 RepID=UPI0006D15D6D|nr:PAC2 family protein [Microbacterium sp. No. 7]
MSGLGERVLVVAFDGWNDAGDAASSATAHLRRMAEYEPIFSADPEPYFDYQYTRPQLRVGDDGVRRIAWPEITVWRPRKTDGPVSFWLLTGVEPARAWQHLTADLIDVALGEDITGMVTLGSMMSDVPHTRPITIYSGSDNDTLRAALGLERPTYEGPVGILSVLEEAAEEAGIPSASLWASVPHYIGGHTPSPKATLALLDRLAELARSDIARGDLPAEALAWEASIDAAAADDEDMTEYIRQLERTRDTWDSPEASGDAIAQEFERYLRRRGDGPGERGPGDKGPSGWDGPRR